MEENKRLEETIDVKALILKYTQYWYYIEESLRSLTPVVRVNIALFLNSGPF